MNCPVRKVVRENIARCLLLIFSAFILCFANTQSVYSQNILDLKNSDSTVIEFLRLSVASRERDAWLKAELNSWEPWLKSQKGFLGRQLLWDPQREEALLLIRWASRADWKSIPQKEVDNVQKLFEEIAMESIGNNLRNPFPIKSQGEFIPQ